MNRNQNSHFSKNPQVDIQRSRFDRSSSMKCSFNVGDLVPFFVDEVLPGDTFSIDTSKLVRMQTLITPVMDNIYLDTYYFFVPNRLIWSHWREFMGENTNAPWIPTVTYRVPQIEAPTTSGWPIGSIADYMGIPTGVKGFTVSDLPFRAYGLIWNEWFRDENLQTPQNIPLGDSNVVVGADVPAKYDINSAAYGGWPLPAGKFRDYFTSCLPSPQKGPDVLLPLGDMAPVYSLYKTNPGEALTVPDYNDPTLANVQGPMSFIDDVGASGPYAAYFQTGDTAGSVDLMFDGNVASPSPTDLVGVSPNNLWTDLTRASAATVNQLRLAFAIQRIYEKDARGGTRYIEILANHFGVTSPDSRLQRPEYLGGNRMLINVNQVVQNSESQTTPQGTTTAYSLTVDTHSDFTQSFVEHGFIIGVMCARYDHTYQQGLEKFWSRKDRFDYYFPSLANIGEQPVYNREIFLQGKGADTEVFGYQEAWADYRYKPSRVSGEMRSSAPTSLDVWHLADYYDSQPFLSDEWIREDSTNVDRVLAVTSSVSNQLFGDFYIKNYCTRPMPLFSIPGLIDHH